MESIRNDASVEVLIVGAGPIGLELAAGLKRAGIPYCQLEAKQIGATIFWYPPQTHFFSSPERIAIAGVPLQTLDQSKATREEYLNYLRGVVAQYDLQVETGHRVTAIERQGDQSFVVTSTSVAGDHQWSAKRVVLAIGDMHYPRLIGVPGEDLPHVSHYFADPHLYFRKRVVIVGGKNSAVEAAIRCARVGAKVTLVHRGEGFDSDRVKAWLLPEIRALVRDGRVTFLTHTRLREILPDRVRLEPAATDEDEVTAETSEVPVDAVLLLTGYVQDPTLFERAGIVLEGEERRPHFDEQTMETNVAGVFVAGTAVAGTQIGGVRHFIETSHIHVERILAALQGAPPPRESPGWTVPES